jgi:signal transduction histidine kinase
MSDRPLKKIFHSLYVRLLFIYGLTFILIALAVFAGFRLMHQHDIPRVFHDNVQIYADYLIKDIGTPPNIDRAFEIQKKTGLEMAISGPGINWVSSDDFRRRLEDTRRRRFGHHYLQVDQNRFSFFFSGPSWPTSEERTPGFAVSLGLIAIILLFNHLLIRRVFRPITWMKEGAEAFAEGRWSAKIPVHSQDELGSLSRTMNSMAEKIFGHFQNMRELLAAISHELRSPLTRMRVALEFVSDDKIRNSLNEEITLLDRMTEAILERERLISKPEILDRSAVDARALLIDLTRPYLNQKPGIKLELPAGPVYRSLDRNRMVIAIRNLVENSLKYSDQDAKPVEVKLFDDGIIEVKDYGPGFSKESLSRLGEPFFKEEKSRTGSRSQGGFGLGLSLAYSIVKAHGGTIEVKSDEGEGSLFRIVLPSADC